MSRRNLCLWAATATVALLAVVLVVWQRTHAASPCQPHSIAGGRLIGLTAEQVEERLGKPDVVGGATLLGEREVWEYDSVYKEAGASRPAPLFIHFDAHGRVCRACTFDGTPVQELRRP